jgi:hypothetical protein
MKAWIYGIWVTDFYPLKASNNVNYGLVSFQFCYTTLILYSSVI